MLVGHSYGGAVITNAAVGHDNVEALVYIAGFAPDEGESLLQLVTMNPGSEIGPDTLITRPYPLPDGSQGIDLYLTREGLGTAFAADVPRRVADQMHATQRPFSRGRVREPLRHARLEDHPVVVPRGHRGPGHPAGDAAVHGRASRSPHQRGGGLARAADLPA